VPPTETFAKPPREPTFVGSVGRRSLRKNERIARIAESGAGAALFFRRVVGVVDDDFVRGTRERVRARARAFLVPAEFHQ